MKLRRFCLPIISFLTKSEIKNKSSFLGNLKKINQQNLTNIFCSVKERKTKFIQVSGDTVILMLQVEASRKMERAKIREI